MATRAKTTWRSSKTGENLLKIFAEHEEVCVFDTETTGLDGDNDRIIQISGIKLNTKTFEEINRIDMYINPGSPLPAKITEITGITDAMLADKPTEEEAFPMIYDFFGGESPVIIAYNTPFDKKFVTAMYARNGKTFSPAAESDALEMARDLVKKGETENHKLGTIAHYFGVDEGLTFHNSMDDVIATVRVLKVFKEKYEDREKNKVDVKLIEPYKVLSIHFWQGFRGYSRLYINTDIGTFYYDIRAKVWGVKPDNPFSLNEVDMERVKELSFKYAGVTTECDFSKFKG